MHMFRLIQVGRVVRYLTSKEVHPLPIKAEKVAGVRPGFVEAVCVVGGK